MNINYFFLLLPLSALILGCNSDPISTPKPRGYPKVVYPEKVYQAFDKEFCQFTFEYPRYAQIEQKATFFDEKPTSECWFDITVPSLSSQVHCSYYEINEDNTFDKLRDDAFKLTYKHSIKANSISEIPISMPERNVDGFIFDLTGPVATTFTFYLTDSTDHFLRGALYFNTQARPDSLAPVYNFIKDDILHMIETFQWNAD